MVLWLWFLCWENPLFNFTGGQSVCCITSRVEVVVAALALPPDLRRKHQQGERRYMVEKTVICWKSRKSFCTVVDDDDDMLSVPPEPLWVSPYFYYTAAAATTTALTPATNAAIVATPAVDSLIYSRVRHNKSSLLSPLSLLLLSQLLSLESFLINFRNKHQNDTFIVFENHLKSLFFKRVSSVS